MSNASFTIDDRQWQAYTRKFTPREIDKIMAKASGAGARAAAKVIKAQAPIGQSARPSQFYRQNGVRHGAFKRSVRAARIRARGANAGVIGHVIGPMGKLGFTRAWVEGGTKPHGYKKRPGRHPGSPGRHWFEAAAGAGEDAAKVATTHFLEQYGRDK